MPISIPLCPAQITKLVAASACDMVASSTLLHHIFAVGALPKVQIVFEEIDFVFITFPFVRLKEAFWTIYALANIALQGRSFPIQIHNAFAAFFIGTHAQILVLRNDMECMNLFVLFLYVVRQVFVKFALLINDLAAGFVGTDNFFEHPHFVDGVVLETGITELVLTVRNLHFFLWFILTITNSADERVFADALQLSAHFHGGIRLLFLWFLTTRFSFYGLLY